jgi:uncharacterized protein (TIGR03086 family)
MSDPVELLDRTFRATGRVVAGVKPDQLDDSTPCTEWTVRDLLNHMVGIAQLFDAAARGEEPTINPFGMPEDIIGGDDVQAAYDNATSHAIDAWKKRGLDGTVKIAVGEMPAGAALTICIADELIHGWDLATAIGQSPDYDDEALETTAEFTQKMMGEGARGPGKAFGPVVDVPHDAPKITQLVAFMGRTP